MTSAFSWQNSISLCPASFYIPRPNLPVTPGVSWLPTFAFQSPIMKMTSFLGVSSKRSSYLLQRYWLGHRLGLPWYWMVCLGNEQRSFCCFWDCLQVLHFVDHDGSSISSKGFLPTVVDIMVQGQGQQPRGATPHPRSGVVAEMSYHTPEVRAAVDILRCICFHIWLSHRQGSPWG